MKRIFSLIICVFILSACNQSSENNNNESPIESNNDASVSENSVPEQVVINSDNQSSENNNDESLIESNTDASVSENSASEQVDINTDNQSSENNNDESPIESNIDASVSENSASEQVDINTNQLRFILAEQNNQPVAEFTQTEMDLWVEQFNQYSEQSFLSFTGNNIVAPYNEYVTYSALLLAATNHTYDEIVNNLSLQTLIEQTNDDVINAGIYNINQQLQQSNILETASFSSTHQFIGIDGYALKQDFLNSLTRFFNSELLIGSWEEGDEKVAQLNYQSDLSLLWQTPFLAEDDVLADFTLLDESTIEIPMINTTISTLYYSDGNETIMQLPTTNSEWEFYLTSTANINDYDTYTRSLSLTKIADLKSQMLLSNINVTLPKFHITSGQPNALANDDITTDLSNINSDAIDNVFIKYGSLTRDINVTETGIHITTDSVLSVNTKPIYIPTNSVTISIGNSIFGINYFLIDPLTIYTLPTISSIFDRPFTFLVFHKNTGTLMYAGNLVNPA